MTRLMKLCGLLALVATLATASMPAQAATTYEIKGSKVFFGPDDAFVTALCDPAYVSSPLNGLQSVVIPINNRAAHTLTVSWTGDRTIQQHLGGNLGAKVLSDSCVTQAVSAAGFPGSWPIAVPANSRWLLITSHMYFNVRITVP